MSGIPEVKRNNNKARLLWLWGHLAAEIGAARVFADMYGASGVPELIQPAGPPLQPGPGAQHGQDSGPNAPNPQRLGQRAPKLGQIGRSKKGETQRLR